ncbi:hypothetical protein F750_5393 [Streptomyces sp. PAMC 26508]|nr:hypothetical protein F750_5393 [Streptomyces sp. PAMC 26508]
MPGSRPGASPAPRVYGAAAPGHRRIAPSGSPSAVADELGGLGENKVRETR